MKAVLRYLPQYTVLFMIRLYQKTISFDHGVVRHLFPNGYCKFYPTCSEYGFKCIKKHGLFKGSWFTIWRILRCNPFSNGGVDEPPSE